MAITQRRMTLEEFLKLPEADEKPYLEFHDGRVTEKVSPKIRHSALQIYLAMRVDRFGVPSKLARAFPELRTTFGGNSFVPDVAVYRWERIPSDERGMLPEEVFDAPPDIAIEIVSPGQSIRGLAEKCRWYVANGVQVALLVNPRTLSVTIFRSGTEPVTLRATGWIELGDVIDGFGILVEELFASLRAR
jgi:Uma2 family endonuclease